MPHWMLNVKDFSRGNHFPFRVEQVYYCNDMPISAGSRMWNCVEVCIRLAARKDFTEDVVDGQPLKMSCPNVVWRLPGSVWELPREDVRNVISFRYAPAVLPLLTELGMMPEKPAWNFVMTSEMEQLIGRFHRVVHQLYTPGGMDMMDWICFSMMATLKLQENMISPVLSVENRIRNISIWFRTHFAESIDLDKVAAANGFSHDHFFKMWKKYFDTTPAQYINDLRLEAAARRLTETPLAISRIIQEVHFAGEYQFYKRFFRKYGMTPREYRQYHRGRNDLRNGGFSSPGDGFAARTFLQRQNDAEL